jgi:ectoine utilization protein EutC
MWREFRSSDPIGARNLGGERARMKITILREQELRESVGIDHAAIKAVEEGFTYLARGKAFVPPIVGIEVPERRGELDIKSAFIEGLERFAIKIASGFYANEMDGLPVASGMMILINSRTGYPEAGLFDNGYLTQVRTAAAGAVAARYLANQEIGTVGVIGAGLQGRYQILALGKVREFERILVFDSDPEKSAQYAVDMTETLGVDVLSMDRPDSLVAESDLVVTATPSRTPYLQASWLHPGLHITAMGSDMEEKQELHADVLSLADVVCCDLKAQCAVRGELHHAMDQGLITPGDRIIELGELILGRVMGRTQRKDITVCDLTGVGVQDTAIANLAYEEALRRGLGIQMEV